MSWRSTKRRRLEGRGLLREGSNRAVLNRAPLSFRNHNESKVRRRIMAEPQATYGKPGMDGLKCVATHFQLNAACYGRKPPNHNRMQRLGEATPSRTSTLETIIGFDFKEVGFCVQMAFTTQL